MAQPDRCPDCGAALSDGGGPCRRCLLAFGLDAVGAPPLGPGFLDDLPATDGELFIADNYRVLEVLGRGGMGVVYKAWQANLDRVVAVKVLSAGAHAGAAELERFKREAMMAGRLQHPGIVAIHDWGEDEGVPFFSMEYVPGKDLARVVAESGPMESRRAAGLVLSVANAVAYAHQHQVLHRDLKPQNLLLNAQGTVKITDFGLAKPLDSGLSLTDTGLVLGTAGYMAPEQERGLATIGPAVDVYGLGAVLYHLLTGRAPFVGNAMGDVLAQVRSAEPISPRRLNPGVPPDLETICLACLEKEPRRRYASAPELAEELERFLGDRPIRRRPVGPVGRWVRWSRRNPVMALLSAGLLGSLLAGLATTTWQWRLAVEANAQLRDRQVHATLERAETEFSRGASRVALSSLAEAVDLNPRHPLAVSRLLNALRDRTYPVPRWLLGPGAGPLMAARLSPDGLHVVTLDLDGNLQVWDLDSGTPRGNPWWHTTKPSAFAFSRRGDAFLTASVTPDASGGFAARAWRTTDGAPLSPWLTHALPVVQARWVGEGESVATVLYDGQAIRWDLATGRPLLQIPGDPDARVFEISEGGEWLLAGSIHGTVRRHDLRTGEALEPVLHADGAIKAFAAGGPGRPVVALTEPGHAWVWDSPDGSRIRVATHLHLSGPFSAALSPSGHRLLIDGREVSTEQPCTVLIDLEPPGTPILARIRGYNLPVAALSPFSTNGHSLLLVGDREASAFSADDGQPRTEPLQARYPIEDACLDPPGDSLVAVAHETHVVVHDIREGRRRTQTVSRVAETPRPRFHVSHDGAWVAAVGAGLQIDRTDGTTSLQARLDNPGVIALVRWSRDGTFLACLETNGLVRFRNRDGSRSDRPILRFRGQPTALEFAPGDRFLVGTRGDEIHVQDLAPSAPPGGPAVFRVRQGVPTPAWGDGGVYLMRFDPKGSAVAVACHNGTAQLWDLEARRRRHLLQHRGPVLGVSWDASGDRLATASVDQTAGLWDARTGRQMLAIPHDQSVMSATLSPDGSRLVTVESRSSQESPGGFRIWDARTGKALARCPVAGAADLFVIFNPGGSRFATWSPRGEVRVWDVDTGLPVSESWSAGPIAWNPVCWAAGEDDVLVLLEPGGSVRRVNLTVPPLPAPPWLTELAFAVAGMHREDGGGRLDVARPSAVLELRRRLTTAAGDDFYTRWGRWFFDDRVTRAPDVTP